MVTTWQCTGGFIHASFLKSGEITNAEKYCTEVHQSLRDKWPSLVNINDILSFPEIARSHVLRHVQELHEFHNETIPHLTYSPDIFPSDYNFFKHFDYVFFMKKIHQ